MSIDLIIGLIMLAVFGFFLYRFIRRAGKFVTWMRGSLESDGKASARKISAFITMWLVMLAHSAWLKKAFMENDFSLLTQVLIIDFGFISICLGLKTAETIFSKKPSEPPGPTGPLP